MKLTWTKGLTAKEKEEICLSFSSNATFRLRAIKIMEDKIDAERKRSVSSAGYESPNWALKQADSNGYIRALEEMISLM